MSLPPVLHPQLNPTGLAAAAGAIYAAAEMIYNAVSHHGVISLPVVISAVAAVIALLTHQIVTPVAAPRDNAGNPLVPVTVTERGISMPLPSVSGLLPAPGLGTTGEPPTAVKVVPPDVDESIITTIEHGAS